MSAEGQRYFVEHDYRNRNVAAALPNPRLDTGSKREVESLLRRFPELGQGNARALDVGTMHGAFCAALESAGIRATGIDPYRDAIDFGRRHGLDLHVGRFEPEGLPESLKQQTFDLISFRESIYYCPDWRELFDLLRRMVKPGGALYLRCHLVTSLYYLTEHDLTLRYGISASVMPDEKSLLQIMNREGFRVVRCEAVGPSLWLPGEPSRAKALAAAALNKLIARPIEWLGRSDRLVIYARRI